MGDVSRRCVGAARTNGHGEVLHIRTPIKIGESVRVRTISPKLGPHNAKIFGCVGLDEVEVKNLRAKGVL